MVGILSKEQIDYVLQSSMIGRLGCCVHNKPYVVPIAYAFDGKYIYGHAHEGMKIKIMRKNVNVCFEVDDIDSMVEWRCIILTGRYEELKTGSVYQRAMKILTDRFVAFSTSYSSKPSFGVPQGPERVEKSMRSVVFRIAITDRSGRFEKLPG